MIYMKDCSRISASAAVSTTKIISGKNLVSLLFRKRHSSVKRSDYFLRCLRSHRISGGFCVNNCHKTSSVNVFFRQRS